MTKPKSASELDTKVIKALADSKWKYRTVKGISKETKLNTQAVEESLRRNKPIIRVSLAKAPDGSTLYASKQRVSAVSDAWTSFKAMNKAKYGK